MRHFNRSTNPVDSILGQIERRTGSSDNYRGKVERAIEEAQRGTDAGVTVIKENGFYCNGQRVRLREILGGDVDSFLEEREKRLTGRNNKKDGGYGYMSTIL